MSPSDLIDERFSELVAELRAAVPVAPPGLRERVRELAARPPAQPPRRPRLAWLFAPAAVAAVAGAIVLAVGNLSSDDGAPQPALSELAASPKSDALGGAAKQAPVAPGRRAQRYAADLTLRVRDLSATTQQALRTTRRLGGYLRSVDYGSGTASGTADFVLRVPVGRVQPAIVAFSGLGTILEQHVSVRDAQPALDRRFARIAELRRTIPSLEGEERAQAETELRALQRAQARERQQTSFATVSLHLRTKDAAAAVPTSPTRIERALHRAVDVVAAEIVAIVYVLVVAGPVLVLGGALLLGARTLRRRRDAQLFA